MKQVLFIKIKNNNSYQKDRNKILKILDLFLILGLGDLLN